MNSNPENITDHKPRAFVPSSIRQFASSDLLAVDGKPEANLRFGLVLEVNRNRLRGAQHRFTCPSFIAYIFHLSLPNRETTVSLNSLQTSNHLKSCKWRLARGLRWQLQQRRPRRCQVKYANEEMRVGTSARAGPFAPLHGSGVTIALHCGADKTSHFPQSTFVYLSEAMSEATGETELPRARCNRTCWGRHAGISPLQLS